MRDVKTLLLALVSLLLVATWVFHLYDKSKYAAATSVATVGVDSAALKRAVNDSIRQLYQTALEQINQNTVPAADTAAGALELRMREIDSLKQEISAMLNEQNITREDLAKALIKIQELQRQLSRIGAVTTVRAATTTTSNSPAATRPAAATTTDEVMQAADVRLQAVFTDEQSRINSTSRMLEAEQLGVSFTLRNNSTSFPGTWVYVVIKAPSGITLQDDEWQAGMFTTNTEGSLRYTRRLNFDYGKGEQKKINVSVALPRAEAGLYQLSVYHNGYRIGRADCRLN